MVSFFRLSLGITPVPPNTIIFLLEEFFLQILYVKFCVALLGDFDVNIIKEEFLADRAAPDNASGKFSPEAT